MDYSNLLIYNTAILHVLQNDMHLQILHMRLSLGLSHTDKYLQLFWIYNEEFDLMVL